MDPVYSINPAEDLHKFLYGMRQDDLLSLIWGIEDPIFRIILSALLGLCVGSFLNVVALRSLAETSWFWPPSTCMSCQKRLGCLDLIPIFSYLSSGGKCRHCQALISWHYPLVEFGTAILFIAILHIFGWSINGLAMLIFTSTLVAVTVTDFKEKLIPHEITYPSMIIGILYSTAVCGDGLGTLAGIGASYIIFDFIDFYGLMLLRRIRPEKEEDYDLVESEIDESDPSIDRAFDLASQEEEAHRHQCEEEEEIVMGGGDAVLSAVIAAWLGWQKMALAISIAFLVGAIMGGIYLFMDLHKRGDLANCIKPGIIGFVIGFSLIYFPMLYMVSLLSSPTDPMTSVLSMSFAGGAAGAMVGIIFGGSRFENRFPFGPAIALGALISMFINIPGQDRNLVPEHTQGHKYPKMDSRAKAVFESTK